MCVFVLWEVQELSPLALEMAGGRGGWCLALAVIFRGSQAKFAGFLPCKKGSGLGTLPVRWGPKVTLWSLLAVPS